MTRKECFNLIYAQPHSSLPCPLHNSVSSCGSGYDDYSSIELDYQYRMQYRSQFEIQLRIRFGHDSGNRSDNRSGSRSHIHSPIHYRIHYHNRSVAIKINFRISF